MSEDVTPSLGKVVRIDDQRIEEHLGRIVRGTVEETLNGDNATNFAQIGAR